MTVSNYPQMLLNISSSWNKRNTWEPNDGLL